MDSIIQPRVLKGFRDCLPDTEIVRASLTEKLVGVFRAYGFVPIDTPCLEYSEILLRKGASSNSGEGETEKQVFRFTDNGGRDVALRFDLTVPFARFVAEHKAELVVPFKRYHIAKVWRGEKPQAGRYREFMQCDFDTIGSESAASDFEILLLMKAAFEALEIDSFTIRINHRGVFNAVLARLGIREKSEAVLRAVDKLTKAGADGVKAELEAITGSTDTAREILAFVEGAGDFDSTLALMERSCGADGGAAVARLKTLRAMMYAVFGGTACFSLDPSITRGLDYYTGIVFETFLDDLPGIGSVCSGGRYDNLAGLYTKEKIPGVGASIGLDRLVAGLEQLGKLPVREGYIDAEIFCMDDGEDSAKAAQTVAAALRARGVCAEVFPDAKKIGQQYTFAEKKRIPFGILPDSDGVFFTLKNLSTREQFGRVDAETAAKIIRSAGS
jgi:histidyl-tRNA synthetase